MKLKKLLFISLFSAVSLNSIAASNTENIKVTALVQAGCIVSAQDISFGDLQVSQSNRSIQAIAQAPLTLQCSKGTNIQLTGSDKNNPGFVYGARLWLEGATKDERETRIVYGVQMNNVTTNSNISVTKAARNHYLWNVAGNHHFNFKINTSNQVVLPIYGQLLDHRGITADSTIDPLDLFSIKPGNYTDDFVYTLTF
jgi:hypothetical protein